MKELRQVRYIHANRNPIIKRVPDIGRNEPCPCGTVLPNGKRPKYKNCCYTTEKKYVYKDFSKPQLKDPRNEGVA